MNLFCDEGVERQIVDSLRAAGHHVLYVAELETGIPDDEVLARANEASAVLVTNDKDFGELVYRRGSVSRGVILLRLAGVARERKADIVASVVRKHGPELAGAFSVVSPGSVRIRPGR